MIKVLTKSGYTWQKYDSYEAFNNWLGQQLQYFELTPYEAEACRMFYKLGLTLVKKGEILLYERMT